VTNIPVGILGTGSYVPAKVVTNYELERRLDTNDQWIVERTGIRERHVICEQEATSDLAVQAARQALEQANLLAKELDLIIVATVTPDTPLPDTACWVQKKLEAVNATAFDVTAACAGFVYALAVGRSFVQTGLYKHVLVIGAEALSTITDWNDRNTAILFGDGAGAVVLGAVEAGYGILGLDLGADGSGADALKVPAGGSLLPASLATVIQRLHFIHMEGNEVFKFAVRIMGETANKALMQAGLDAQEVDWLVPHQANIRIIQAAAKRIGIPTDKVIINADKYGNTSAASIPLALDEAVRDRRIKRDDTVVLVGFGGGLAWGAVVIKWLY
jgi:3-oxoacyl-[acyl-carrier-protein] synthase-3